MRCGDFFFVTYRAVVNLSNLYHFSSIFSGWLSVGQSVGQSVGRWLVSWMVRLNYFAGWFGGWFICKLTINNIVN